MSAAELLDALSTLPPTVSPYAALAQMLSLGFSPPFHASFQVLLRVCSGLAAFLLLLATGNLVVTLMTARLWICRQRSTPAGRLLHLNTDLLALLSHIVHLALIQLWISQLIFNYYGGGTFSDGAFSAIQWTGAGIWLSFVLLFAFPTYAVTASAFIRASATPRGRLLRSWHFHVAAALFGASIITILGLWLASGAQAQRTESALVDALSALAAVPWSPGERIVPDPAWLLPVQRFFDEAESYFSTALLAFGWLDGVVLFNAVIGVPATISHLIFLRQHERIGRRAVSAFLRSHRQTELESARILEKRMSIRRTTRSLAFEAAAVSLLSCVFGTIVTWCATNLRALVSSGTRVEIAFITCMLSTYTVGLPLHSVLLLRSIRAYRRSRAQARPVLDFATGVRITHETHQTSVKEDDAAPETVSRDSSDAPNDHLDFAVLAIRADSPDHRALVGSLNDRRISAFSIRLDQLDRESQHSTAKLPLSPTVYPPV